MTKLAWLVAIGSVSLLIVYGSSMTQSTVVEQQRESTITPMTVPSSLTIAGDTSDSPSDTQPNSAEEPQEAKDLIVPDSVEPKTKGPGVTLFDFADSEPAWYTVDDNVMGGISQSTVVADDAQGLLTFSGTLSLENNGGFASTRSQWLPYDLGAFDAVVLRVRGDGNAYRFRIRTEATGSEIAYTAIFQTESNQWTEVYIAFSEMVPLYRGFVVEAAGPLDPTSIRSFGLMMTDKQEGEFMLEVDWINAIATSHNDIRNAGISSGNAQNRG
jgi:hypothetical protein